MLLDALWPDRDPVSAMNNLHQALHVARRVLADDEPSNGWLELRDDVVVLLAGGLVEVDVRRFQQLTAVARASGDLADLRAATVAYTGDLLPEDRFEDWAMRPREELRETFCDLLVDLADAASAAGVAGNEAEAFDALQRALATDPLHERAVRGLMRSQAAAGRRSEALARYEQLRGDLRATYGTDPDPDTRHLYRDLLTSSFDEPKPQATELPQHNLAPALTSFVGREREIADVHSLLRRGGLLTLTGVGGAGKTRLAEEAARGLLSAVPRRDMDRRPGARGRPAAGCRYGGERPRAGSCSGVRSVAYTGRPLGPAQPCCSYWTTASTSLAACAALATALRRSCPGVTVLATSREPLHVPGEVTFRVPSLELPEPEDGNDPDRLARLASVRLFLDRAQDVRPGFMLDGSNSASIVEICRRLDGIPLALELAAARMSHLESAEIAERLGEALALLGRRGEITRHATLRATLEWSHALLSPDEQTMLRRLAVFAGSFSLQAVEQVCADELLPRSDVLDCLGRIVDKSLVQVERAGLRSRYRLLETIRQMARERLVAAREVEALEAAHCRHFLDLALAHDPERTAGVVVERPQVLDVDHDNLRGALGWALRNDPEQALLLGVSLWRYWLARGHFVEGAGWLERILELPLAPTRERARALFGLAILDARRGLGGPPARARRRRRRSHRAVR